MSEGVHREGDRQSLLCHCDTQDFRQRRPQGSAVRDHQSRELFSRCARLLSLLGPESTHWFRRQRHMGKER